MTETKVKGKQGFASMDREKQRRIASEGGRIAHKLGKAHKWDVDEAREAGRKGGATLKRGSKQHETV